MDATFSIFHAIHRLIFAAVLLSPCTAAMAQRAPDQSAADRESAAAGEERSVLTVATREVPPFAVKDETGNWSGIAIELWETIGDELGFESEYVDVDLDEMVSGLKDDRYDAAVAALTMTADREAAFDFSHPFFNSGLGIAVSGESDAGWWQTVKRVVSARFLQAVGALAVLLLLVGLVVWALERRHNKEQFGGTAAHGVASGFWWSAVTMTTVGYGDKAPATVGGRLVALVWMFASIIVISSFTASIASALTVSQLNSSINGPQDLPGLRVGALTGSTSEDYLRQRGIRTFTYPDAETALQRLEEDKIDAVVYDAPVLRYLVNQERFSDLRVLVQEFRPQDYSIGLPEKSKLREPVNQILLREVSSPGWQERINRYLGT